ENLMSAIEEQMQRNVQLKNEFFLVDAINIMLEHHSVMRVEKIETWLDTGTIDATLETNRFLLERNSNKTQNANYKNVKIVEPVFIHESAKIEDSTIGPYASIAADCQIRGSHIEDSIIEAECEIKDAALKCSMVGTQAKVHGRGVKEFVTLNIGDNSSVMLG
ncbi:MAG TPA: hypothetical protein VIN60_07100, partial [Anaerolineales bacterium]